MRFFQDTFLVANTTMEIVLEMPFLTFNNVKINFPDQELNWETYTQDAALSKAKHVQMIN